MKAGGTSYEIFAQPIFGSTRWRFEICSRGAGGKLVVAWTSASTFPSEAKALTAGADRARAIARQLRRDLQS